MVLRTARGTVAQPRHREITEMNFDHLAIVLYSYHHQLGDEHGDANKNRTGQSFFEVSETSRKVPRQKRGMPNWNFPSRTKSVSYNPPFQFSRNMKLLLIDRFTYTRFILYDRRNNNAKERITSFRCCTSGLDY